jgi:hypothetical protein
LGVKGINLFEFLHLTPFIPLSLEGEGESIFRRGALAPLKHPIKFVFVEEVRRKKS